MHRFGEQIEFRIDRRQIFLLFLGGLFWTLLSFFLGMMAAQRGSVRKHLVALGWLDTSTPTQRRKPSLGNGRASVSFVMPNHAASRSNAKGDGLSKDDGSKRDSSKRNSNKPPVKRLKPLGRGKAPVLRAQPKRRPKPVQRVRPERREPPKSRGHIQQPRRRNVARASKAAYNIAQHNTVSLLAEARAYRKAEEGQGGSSLKVSKRLCGRQIQPERGRYAIVVKTKTSLRSIRRWRTRLGRRGYFARVKRVRLKRRRRFRLVVGRFVSRSQARRCVSLFQRQYKLPGTIMALSKMK